MKYRIFKNPYVTELSVTFLGDSTFLFYASIHLRLCIYCDKSTHTGQNNLHVRKRLADTSKCDTQVKMFASYGVTYAVLEAYGNIGAQREEVL